MVVSRDYMLKQPSGPSAPKLFLDTKLVPAAVNILGDSEVALNRASLRTGLSAGLILGIAGLGSVGLCWLLLRRRPRLESHTPQLQEALRSLN
ncbi:MAG TPA: hypothetical protein VF637_15100 [Sphingomicrobium sp.]